MRNKEDILAELQMALNTGILSESDIAPLVTQRSVISTPKSPEPPIKTDKLSAVDVMFYIAGIVLFSTIMSIIIQSWNDGNPFVHILLSAFVGSCLWVLAYYLIKNNLKSDIRTGLTNSLLLTGSLLIISGGYIIINEIIGGYGEVNFIPAAIALAVLGGVHIGFDRLIKRELVLLMGVLLAVSSFPVLIFGFLLNVDVPMDVWAVVLTLTSLLLVFATRVVAKINADRPNLASSFDSFAAFLALLTMYIASYGDYGVLWLGVLIGSVFGIFYLSIVLRNKHLLGNASLFLVLSIITIAFRYFSGYGTTFSLIVATIGLLSAAAIASSINKKYFKQPSQQQYVETTLPQPPFGS